MVETLILLVIAVALGLYALRELAPRQWAALYRPRRGTSAASSSTAAGVVLEDAGGAVLGREWAAPPAAAMPLLGARSRVLALWAPLVIVALAFALRVVNLTGVPFGFFCDEASPTLDAYWIAHTLHDQHGAFLPFFPQALNEYPGGFQTYWQIPFVVLFGLTEFAARFGSAVAGVLTVWLTYLFVSKAANRPIGLISAFLLATVPWHIMESRVGWQVNNVPFITALCLFCLFMGLERPRWLPFAFIVGAVGMYGYFAGRVFFPLFCLAWLIIYARPLLRHWRKAAIGVVVALILLIPTVVAVANGIFFARYNQLGNAPLPFMQQLGAYWANYISDFSPSSLFATTDVILRHFVQGFGLLYPVEAPFLVIGVLAMLWRHNRFDVLCLVWLVIYPLGSAVAGSPIFTRGIPGLIVLQIAAAQGIYVAVWGIYRLVTRVRTLQRYRAAVIPAASALLLLVWLGAMGQFMGAYLGAYPLYSSGYWGWQWGAGPIVSYFEAHHGQYDSELMNAEFNAPDELLRFYSTPDTGQCSACTITNVADPAAVRAQYAPRSRQLWAVSPSALQGSTLNNVPHRVVGHLIYPNGQVAFLFVATGPEA